jgi:uncharacterized protein YuzE
MAKVMYDPEAHSLLVYKEGQKAHASISMGEIIISLDKDMKIVAVEILNPDILYRIPEKHLHAIKSASLSVQTRQQLVLIYITLIFEKSEMTIPITVPIKTPLAV